MPRSYRRPKRRFKRKRFQRRSRLATIQKMTGGTPYNNTVLGKIAKYSGVVGKVAGAVGNIMNWINVESKYVDTTAGAAVANTGAYNAILNLVAQGTTESTRTGNKVVAKNVYVNWLAQVNASAIGLTIIRIVIVLDKKPEVGTATLALILTSASLTAPVNRDNTDRFIILKDMSITLPAIANGGTRSGKIFIPLSRIHTAWNSGTSTDFESNRIQLFAIANEATNEPDLSIVARYNYYDN